MKVKVEEIKEASSVVDLFARQLEAVYLYPKKEDKADG